VRNYFDRKIKTIGVRNCYYPLFITRDNLEKEASHVEGFSAEVAWVERGGKSKLEKPSAFLVAALPIPNVASCRSPNE
jgi:prolyl-tRNA synthetase